MSQLNNVTVLRRSVSEDGKSTWRTISTGRILRHDGSHVLFQDKDSKNPEILPKSSKNLKLIKNGFAVR